jgi:hypothetical protein
MLEAKDTETVELAKSCKMQIANCSLRIGDSRIYDLQFAICNLHSHLRVLCVLCGYYLSDGLSASAAVQQVVPVSEEAFFGELVSIGADGSAAFRVATPNVPAGEAKAPRRTLRLDELVRWGNPREAGPRILVTLADGGRLVTAAAWSGGAPLRLEDDTIVVLSNSWGEVRLARSLVRGLVFAERSHPREREELDELVREERSPGQRGSPNSDLVLLTNKDRLSGGLSALSGGSLALETVAGAVKLPLSRVEAVVFSGTQPPVRSSPPEIVIGLRDGSLVYAESLVGADNEFTARLAGNLELKGEVKDIDFLQSLGGPFVYLSDLEPAGFRHVPYLSIDWPHSRDRNVLGGPLTAGGKRYLKGIGMHSAARLTYPLKGEYRRFDAAVAIDDSAGKRGSVIFGVYLQRGGAWTESYTSEVVRGGEAPRPVSVDVSGAQGLTLTVDYADRGDEMDRANWLDARLVR